MAIKREKGANCFTNEPLQVFWQTNTKKNWKNRKMYSVCRTGGHASLTLPFNDLTLIYECLCNLVCGCNQYNIDSNVFSKDTITSLHYFVSSAMQIKKDLKRVSDDLQLNQTNRLRRHSHNAFSNTPSTRYLLLHVLILDCDIFE